MGEHITTKLTAESHLLLDQPLLRLPNELNKKNLRTARAALEKFQTDTTTALDSTTKSAVNGSQPQEVTLASLDAMLNKAQTLKRKLESLHQEEQSLHRHQKARLQHLQDLHDIPSLVDVKYDRWSRVRLDRLLVDYLLRMGYKDSATQLAQEKGIQDLVDVDAFLAAGQIESSLRQRRTQECLAWCSENKRALKETNSNLESELRLQQLIEMTRSGQTSKLIEAALHARKYLGSQQEYGFRAGGLLVYRPDTTIACEPYKSLYAASRWDYLADMFVTTHNEIFSLPPKPLLHIALSAGLSALKTPACHSVYASSSSNASSSTTSVCPICSTELNELARNVPYAHHSKSYVENDPVVLPNGRIYGRDRLLSMNEKLGTPDGRIRDPTNHAQEYDMAEIKKVFIS